MSVDSWRLSTSDDGLASLVFDASSGPHNILTPAAIEGLETALNEVDNLPAPPLGLVLKSGKARGFCAGADLKTVLATNSPAVLERYFERGRVVLEHLRRLRLPTIALVGGVCLGGGLELALACDAIALEPGASLRVGTPEINFGLIPGWGAIPELARRIGVRTAVNWLGHGTDHTAEEAVQLDLVEVPRAGESMAAMLARLALKLRENPRDDDVEFEPISSFRTPTLAGPAQERAYLTIINLLLIDGLDGQEEARKTAVRELARLACERDTRAALQRFFLR